MKLTDLSYEELTILKQAVLSLRKYGYDPYGPNYDKEIKAVTNVERKIDSAILSVEAFEEDEE